VWSVFKIAARAAIWRATRDPRLVGLPTLIGWILVLAAVRCALQFAEALPAPGFNPYGFNAVIAWLAIALVVTACFVPPPARVTALSAMVVLSVLTEIVLGSIKFAAPLIQSWLPMDAFAASYPALYALWTGFGAPVAMFLAPAVSWTGAMFAILRSFEAGAPLRVLGKVIALWAALFVAKNALPHAPVFSGPSFDARSANLWEYVRARHLAPVEGKGGHGNPDTTGLALGNARRDLASGHAPRDPQRPALLQAAFEQLAPQTPGTTDVYAIGLAGWLDQDVFIKELDGAFASMGRVLPLRDHTIRLSNYPETYASLPIANRENFAAAVHAVAQVMDKDEDVLLLLMTSHGATDGVALQLPGGGQTLLSPDEVADILRREGIKHRIVIVSACYGGVFVKPLADDDTIVLTAADDKHTSFGCAPGRDWTYFGDALFNQALRPGVDLKYAFSHARLMIAGWERMEGLTPSNPQGHFGSALLDKLAPVLEAMRANGH
jgi:Peptidase C13 family